MKKKHIANNVGPRPRQKKGFPVIVLVALIGIGLTAGLLGHLAKERRHEAEARRHESTAHKAEYGGIVNMVGHRKYELVVTPHTVSLHISEDQRPTPMEGGSVTLHYLVDSTTETVKMEQTGDAKFEAGRPVTLTVGRTITVTVNLPSGRVQEVQFDLDRN